LCTAKTPPSIAKRNEFRFTTQACGQRNLNKSRFALQLITGGVTSDLLAGDGLVMRWLIDGYNVMHAGGRLGPKLGREGFRRVRRRFLDDLAAALVHGNVEQTTVVFDASLPPGDFPLQSRYRGIQVVFALGDENADAHIEQLIAADSNPKTLSVISSDRRIRQAAAHRRSPSLSAEEFWEHLDRLAERTARRQPTDAPPASGLSPDELGWRETPEESARWMEAFRGLLDAPDVQEALAPHSTLLTDAEIAEIQREIDREK
jgi:predicted RNA-binding protein with PIN domain